MATKHSKRKTKAHHNHKHHEEDSVDETQQNEASMEDEVRDVQEEETLSAQDDAGSDSQSTAHAETHASAEDVRLEFPYSELVRAYVPKAMDVAEKVATDWKKDGSFMNLGIDNPYANMAVSLGLKKAKEIEKKLDEKGVLSAVRMGVEVLKQQVNKKK